MILGIDPGSLNLGLGVMKLPLDKDFRHCSPIYVGHDVLSVSPKLSFSTRLQRLGFAFNEALQQIQPDHISLEKIFFGRNVDSAFKLGHIRGVCLYQCLSRALVVEEYSTREIKQGITGSGGADKEQVARALGKILKFPEDWAKSYDASDALATAFHHCNQLLLKQKLQLAQSGGKELSKNNLDSS